MKGGEQGQRGAAAVSEGARALIRRCLSVDQRLRPTAAELLADPWLALKDGTGGGRSLGAGAPSPVLTSRAVSLRAAVLGAGVAAGVRSAAAERKRLQTAAQAEGGGRWTPVPRARTH